MITKFLTIFILLAMVLPTGVFAVQLRDQKTGNTSVTERAKPETRANTAAVCERLDAFLNKLGQNLGQANTRLTDARSERSHNLKERGEKNDERLSEVRNNADDNRLRHYEKLRQRAETEAQKQAMEAFIEAVEEAAGVRKAAVDDAIEAYRQGLASAAQTRSAATEQAKKNFEDSVKAAEDQARADCESVDGATVRTRLLAALQTARKQLRADIKTANQVQTTLQELKEARREAIKQAFEDFRKAYQAARKDLKAAFDESDDATTP